MSKYFLKGLVALGLLISGISSTAKSLDETCTTLAKANTASFLNQAFSAMSEIATDATKTFTKPANNLKAGLCTFAAKHPIFTTLGVVASGLYLYSSWKNNTQKWKDKIKNALNLIQICDISKKDDNKEAIDVKTACLKTAARDIIDYYDWNIINPLSWSASIISYNLRFRVVYTAKELIKDIENNASNTKIASTAHNLFLCLKELSSL